MLLALRARTGERSNAAAAKPHAWHSLRGCKEPPTCSSLGACNHVPLRPPFRPLTTAS